MERAEKELSEAARRREVVPLAGMLLPVASHCQFAVVRFERRIAALRCIEAIRLYAARHEGRLPRRLGDIAEVPIPVNPVTAKPFHYHHDGDTTILEADGGPADQPRVRYRLEMAQ